MSTNTPNLAYVRRLLLTAIPVLFLWSFTADAQTTYRTQTDGAYNASSTWVGNIKPGKSIQANDSLIIRHMVFMTSDVDITGVFVMTSAGQLIGSGDKLTIKEDGIFENDGYLDLGDKELHVDGSVYNSGYILVKKVHNDGYICNSGVIEMDPGETFDQHGGLIECWGSIICCEMKMHENSGHLGDPILREQNVCCTDNTATDIDLQDGTIDSSTTFFCDFLLPIDLVSFNASAENDRVRLTWTTAKETDNRYFYIESSQDGENWSEIHRVDGAGNSDRIINYEAWDLSPLRGTNYYRLKQVDVNGEFTYSKAVTVEMPETPGLENSIHIEQSASGLYVQVDKYSTFHHGEILVTDAVGRLLSRQVLNADINSLEAALPEGLGMVIIAVYLDNERYTKKLILNR